MQKTEFLNFLRDADICREIFNIVRHSGKPTNSEIPAVARQFPNKVAFLNFLKDAEVCKAIFEIILRGGKPPASVESPPAPPPKTEMLGGATNRIVALREQIRNRLTNKTPPPDERKTVLGDRLEFIKNQAAKLTQSSNDSSLPTNTEDVTPERFTYVANKNCPVCGIRTKIVLAHDKLKAESVDEDFCMHYRDFNPYLYSICVCEHCGYVTDEEHFKERIPERIRRGIKNFLEEKNFHTPFVEQRDKDEALMLYEMAIYFNEMFERSPGRQAMFYQKMAWLCRLENDGAKEREYLFKCAEKFEQSVGKETYPLGKFTDDMAIFALGTSYYMIGDLEKASKYLGMLASSSQLRTTAPQIYEKACATMNSMRQVKSNK